MSTTPTPRMTGEDLRRRREYLGLTSERLAEVLDVRHDTLRRWESGRELIPTRVPDEVAAIEADTRDAVARVINAARAGQRAAFFRRGEDGALRITEEQDAHGPRWWGHVTRRAEEQLGPRYHVAPTHDGLDDPSVRVPSWSWYGPATAAESLTVGGQWYGYARLRDGSPSDVTDPRVGQVVRATVHVPARGPGHGYDRIVWVRREW